MEAKEALSTASGQWFSFLTFSSTGTFQVPSIRGMNLSDPKGTKSKIQEMKPRCSSI
jgi:hypothetical protein